MTTYTFNKKKVHSPLGKLGVVLFLAVVFSILLLLSPAVLTLHIILRLCGRKGFTTRQYDRRGHVSSYSIDIHGSAFRKASR